MREYIIIKGNERIDDRIIIEAEERKEFLIPWIRKIGRMEKKGESIRTMRIATLLNGCALFKKGKSREGFLSTKSLNNEIIKLRKELKEEKTEKDRRTKRK